MSICDTVIANFAQIRLVFFIRANPVTHFQRTFVVR